MDAHAVHTANSVTADKTLCTIQLNSANEINHFTSNYQKLGYKRVELTELISKSKSNSEIQYNPEEGDDQSGTQWFDYACKSQIQCDILIISGHFGGKFFGDQTELVLPVSELETKSCQNTCSGILNAPREVYLFGCNTLAGKVNSGLTPEQYRSNLRRHRADIPENLVEQLVAIKFSPIGTSFYNTMRRIFTGPKIIYGFSDTAPKGRDIEPILSQYFSQYPPNESRLDQQMQILNRANSEELQKTTFNEPFMKILKMYETSHAVAQTTGLLSNDPGVPIRNLMCQFHDENKSNLEKLKLTNLMIEKNQILEFAMPILKFFDAFQDIQEKRFSNEEYSEVQKIIKNMNLKDLLLKTTNNLTMLPEMQQRLYSFYVKIGWMSVSEQKQNNYEIIKNLFKPLTSTSKDTLCSIPLGRNILQPELFKDLPKLSKLEREAIRCIGANPDLEKILLSNYEKNSKIPRTLSEMEIFFKEYFEVSSVVHPELINQGKKLSKHELPNIKLLTEYSEAHKDQYIAAILDDELIALIKAEMQSQFLAKLSFKNSLCKYGNLTLSKPPAHLTLDQFIISLAQGDLSNLGCIVWTKEFETEMFARTEKLIHEHKIGSMKSLSLYSHDSYKTKLHLNFEDREYFEAMNPKFVGVVEKLLIPMTEAEEAQKAKKLFAQSFQQITKWFQAKKEEVSEYPYDIKLFAFCYFINQRKSVEDLAWEDYTSVLPEHKYYPLLSCLKIKNKQHLLQYFISVSDMAQKDKYYDSKDEEVGYTASKVYKPLVFFDKESSVGEMESLLSDLANDSHIYNLRLILDNVSVLVKHRSIVLSYFFSHLNSPSQLSNLYTYFDEVNIEGLRRTYVIQNLIRNLKKSNNEQFWYLANGIFHFESPAIAIEIVQSELLKRPYLVEKLDSVFINEVLRDEPKNYCQNEIIPYVQNKANPLSLRYYLARSCFEEKKPDKILEELLMPFLNNSEAYHAWEIYLQGNSNLLNRFPVKKFLE